MNSKQIETEIQLCRLILTTVATAKQVLTVFPSQSVYIKNFLDEVADSAAVQISLLQEILTRGNGAGRLDHEVNRDTN